MLHLPHVRRWLPIAAAGLLAASCRNPQRDVTLAETIVELGDAVSALQQDNALLQQQLDSLRTQLARQDTLLRRLAATVAEMPVPTR